MCQNNLTYHSFLIMLLSRWIIFFLRLIIWVKALVLILGTGKPLSSKNGSINAFFNAYPFLHNVYFSLQFHTSYFISMINLSVSVSSHKLHITLCLGQSLYPHFLIFGMLIGFCKYQDMQDLWWASHCLRSSVNMNLILIATLSGKFYYYITGEKTDLWHRLNNLTEVKMSELWSREFKLGHPGFVFCALHYSVLLIFVIWINRLHKAWAHDKEN